MEMRKTFWAALAFCAVAGAFAAGGEYRIVADFSGDLPPRRAMRDIPFPCDLSDGSGVAFDFRVGDPAEFSYASIHFDCAGKWVSAGFSPRMDREWRRCEVKSPKKRDPSADWAHVRALRISGWRGGTNRTEMAVRNIAVVPYVPETPEQAARRKLAEVESNRVALVQLAATPPVRGERRLAWSHNPVGIRGRSWDEAIQVMKKGGFTDLLANMTRGGRAAYRSKSLAFADAANGKDQLEACKAACRRHGVKLHVWNCCWRTGWGTTKDELNQLADEGRLQVADSGEVNQAWLCPTHPANRKMLVDAMLELALEKGVDGVHFDYIRYPDGRYCHCVGCKARFEAKIGKTVTNWPKDVCGRGPLAKEWLAFRREAITSPVREVAEKLHGSGSRVEVSAAVFRDPLSDLDWVGQDWASWCEKGYLDFACPMTYENTLDAFIVKQQKRIGHVTPKVPCYPGIGLSVWPKDGMDVARFAEQVAYLRSAGINGFVVFELSQRFEKLMDEVGQTLK